MVLEEYWLWYARQVIGSTYGHRVSVQNKSKQLTKFGRTLNADDGVKTTVATFQGSVVNETYATGNTIDSVISSSASDTEVVTIEGLTVDANGDRTFVAQQATLTAQTAVPLATPLFRASRIYVADQTYASPASDLVGNVYVYDSTEATGTTSGVPDVATATKVMIASGENQSTKAATSLSSADYWILTGVMAGIEDGSGTRHAEIDIEVRNLGGVWRPMGLEIDLSETGSNWASLPLIPYRIIPPNADVRMVCRADTANTHVGGSINGVLAIKH